MTWRKYLAVGVITLGFVGAAVAQHKPRLLKQCPPPTECPPWLMPAPAPQDPSAPPTTPMTDPGFQDSFASNGEGGGMGPASYNPVMFGDILGGCVGAPIRVGNNAFTTPACMPHPSTSSGFNIAESESPRPQTRVYYNYNYFGNIFVDVTNAGIPRAHLNRHVIGGELAMLGGDASVGLRLPFLQLSGDPGFQSSAVGDLSVILKYALINNRQTGNVFTAGMTVRTPTAGVFYFRDLAGGRTTAQTPIRNVNFQPFGGYVYNLFQNLYVHGFHAVTIPTDNIDVIFMSNDVGLGYWLYRSADGPWLRGIVPTVEIHVNTPFRNRTLPTTVLMQDQVSLTTGAYFLLPRGTLGGAVGIPFIGLHTIEALATYQLRF